MYVGIWDVPNILLQKRRLQNYLIWRSVLVWARETTAAYKDEVNKLHSLNYGIKGKDEPWKSCVTSTNAAFGFAVGALYVRAAFDPQSKITGTKLAGNIRYAFLENLKTLSWMDNDTQTLAAEKANLFVDNIGYSDAILNSSEVDKKFSDLTINENEYFNNCLEVIQYRIRKCIIKLDEISNKKAWQTSPTEVNAFYTALKNRIEIPAGILQSPFFHKNYPKSLNFGGIGFAIGHEFTHGFDDRGRKFDGNGDLNPRWTNETINNFENRTECFVQQYSNYTVNSMHVKGETTISENIADNGGLKLAYLAYQKAIQEEPEKVLPALKFTGRQLFFLSFTQLLCSATTPETAALKILEDEHTPDRFRLIGVLRNNPQFAEAFQCPVNSYMNPQQKCAIW